MNKKARRIASSIVVAYEYNERNQHDILNQLNPDDTQKKDSFKSIRDAEDEKDIKNDGTMDYFSGAEIGRASCRERV